MAQKNSDKATGPNAAADTAAAKSSPAALPPTTPPVAARFTWTEHDVACSSDHPVAAHAAQLRGATVIDGTTNAEYVPFAAKK